MKLPSLLLSTFLTLLFGVGDVLAAFGITTSGSSLVVDTGGGLVFKVGTSSGDITSLVYNSVEYQDSAKTTSIASGFGTSTVTSKIVGSYAVITIVSTAIGGTVTQTYVAKSGVATIFISTHVTAEPTVGELRFIARLKKSLVSKGSPYAEVQGCSIIEGEDVFKCSNGQTYSKCDSKQFIDDQVHGVTGSGVGIWIVAPGTAYEKSSGGPFFRDIDNQSGDVQELYFYGNSGHQQTQAFKIGLFGPYALVFNSGSTPSSSLDTSFFSTLGVRGYTAASGRGTVKGTASGIPSAYSSNIVVGWSSVHAQYWTRASSSGAFTSPLMIPGTYTQTLYKMELAVATSTVTVAAGGSVTANIASAESIPTVIWRIGETDGTPRGFLNANKIETMHPSDPRMSTWAPLTFTVGTTSVSSFPLAQWKSVNNPVTIKFTLTSSQIGARTLVIGTTSAFAGGRPQVTTNGVVGTANAAPVDLNSRGITRGTWRGNNVAYSQAIASGVLVVGTNTIVINVISGSSGTTYLSPNFVYDYVLLK
ncbi:Rhamnogalacturonase B, N-terminal-domain-containing protein [Mrakia frigida]|uniref:Rhamnogalacturonase B, N-terminal-domain-containing protein n=1 Tax=Mrakia frigida TaxID=29902 RepID=UPI003FCC231B